VTRSYPAGRVVQSRVLRHTRRGDGQQRGGAAVALSGHDVQRTDFDFRPRVGPLPGVDRRMEFGPFIRPRPGQLRAGQGLGLLDAVIVVENKKGELEKRVLTDMERRQRMELTAINAERFLAARRKHRHQFTPIGVIQGLDTKSYVGYVHDYIDMGYQHIALGGLVPKPDSEILKICCAVREAIQTRTRTEKENVWLHLFGILRPKIQPMFRLLGVSSFDSASYLRKAWLRSDQNYLAADGKRWYSAIRVPLSSTKRLVETAKEQNISEEELRAMELRCLVGLNNFTGNKQTHQEVVEAVNEYGPLLKRRGEDNHFFEKHDAVLTDRPWEKCRCPVCREIGVDVVVFRGTGRNKRRGFHNTWVLYHKILHGK